MEFEDFWDEFGIRIGPWGIGFGGPRRHIRYSRTDTSHILQIRISTDVKRDQIKARLLEPGLLDIEWPHRLKGQDIPIE